MNKLVQILENQNKYFINCFFAPSFFWTFFFGENPSELGLCLSEDQFEFVICRIRQFEVCVSENRSVNI